MQTSRAYLYFKLFVLFIAVLVAEYVLCGIFYRLVSHTDFWWVDLISGALSLGLCYQLFKNLIKEALKEKIPSAIVWTVFLVFWFLLTCFFRFSVQLVNGLLDFSPSQAQTIVVTDKKISALGGSFKEGPSPMAHLIYFMNWDNDKDTCELLVTPALYYTLGPGSKLELSVRQGFLHMPWVEDYQLPSSPLDRYQFPSAGAP